MLRGAFHIVWKAVPRRGLPRSLASERTKKSNSKSFPHRFQCSFSTSVEPIQLHAEVIHPTKSTNEIPKDDEDYSILFMHGLLGNGRNLKTFARKVVEQESTSSKKLGSCRGGVLLDLRGHGKTFQSQKKGNAITAQKESSAGPNLASTFQDCAQDIDFTLENGLKNDSNAHTLVPLSRVLVGHSFGGRVALEYAAAKASGRSLSKIDASGKTPLKALWLLDTVPGEANETVDRVLKTITNVLNEIEISKYVAPNKIPTRKQIVSTLTGPSHGMDLATAQWLAMSYDEKSGDNFGFDNDLVTRLKPDFAEQDFMGLLRQILIANGDQCPRSGRTTHVHLVRGGKNKGWSVSILSELGRLKEEFPMTFHLHLLPSAGHNVHVDDLSGLVKLFEDAK